MIVAGSLIAGSYEVLSRIGEGGMGVVYQARHTRIGRRVAIKVIRPAMTEDAEALARFEREAQAVMRIGSRHVVDVLDFGNLENGARFMVMEYLEGESLDTRLKREGFLPQPEVVQLGVQVLEGLVKVHEAGIIHRDLKPGNIFITWSHQKSVLVKILDFGVCKITQSQSHGDGEPITTMGQLLGTPAYMAPETMELGPAEIDARSDLFSVGMILRRALAGRLPYEADSVVELLVRRREERPLPLAQVSPDVDPNLAAIVDRAIAAEPAHRFQSAADFKRALVEWTLGRTSQRGPHPSAMRDYDDSAGSTDVHIDVDVELEHHAARIDPHSDPDVDDEAQTQPLRISVPKRSRQ